MVSLQPMGKYAHDKVVPYEQSGLTKKEQVASMFDSIAFRYDFLNRFLSAGIDVSWRKKAIHALNEVKPQIILDVATNPMQPVEVGSFDTWYCHDGYVRNDIMYLAHIYRGRTAA